MTPEALRILRYQLPPFGEGARPSDEMREFARFYGLDFTETRPELEHLTGYVESGPFRLAVHRWSQPEAAANLLIVHGYYDHTGLFSKLVGWGIANRCNVLIFDLPGHGLSTGEPAAINSFSAYSSAIRDVLARAGLTRLPLVALAQSTGCAALTEFARRQPEGEEWPFAATVYLAPLVRPARWRALRLFLKVLNPFLHSIPRGFSENSSDQAFLEFQRRDPLQARETPLSWVSALDDWLSELVQEDLGVGPALIIQGDNDGTVDWPYNVPFMESLYPHSEVFYLPGAGHQLANESQALREQYAAQVVDYLATRGIDLRVPA